MSIDTSLRNAAMGLQAYYNEGLQLVGPDELWWDVFAQEVTGEDASIVIGIEEEVQRFREWVGGRTYFDFSSKGQQIDAKPYECSGKISRDDLDDYGVKLGKYRAQFQGFGRAAKLWPNDILYTALVAATVTTCYDGQPFFSAAHPLLVPGSPPATQSNLIGGNALTQAHFESSVAAFMGIRGKDGKPMNLRPTTLVVPPALEATGKKIVESDMIAIAGGSGSESNVNKGRCQLKVVAELGVDSATSWYLTKSNLPCKPFVFFLRKPPTDLVVLDQDRDTSSFEENIVKMGTSGRGATAGVLWQLCQKNTI
jgi:phage major head subunit gpT-like protein